MHCATTPTTIRNRASLFRIIHEVPILLTTLGRTAGRVHPGPRWSDAAARLKYCVRGLLSPGTTEAWFRVLESPVLRGIAEAHPRLHSKLQRPYLHRRTTIVDRLATLTEHYHFLVDVLQTPERDLVFKPGGLRLADLPVEPAGRYSLRLVYDDQFEKEGDLMVVLWDQSLGKAIFTLSFTITRWDCPAASRQIFIGGLQGRKGANDREDIVALTRALHGLRPKAMLVFAIQRLAQCWGIASLRAVGDAEHIYRHFRKRREINSSYDTFWTESQGSKDLDGNFTLPSHPTVRCIEELAPNKRSMYRKRYALLERLGLEMGDAAAASSLRHEAAAQPVALPLNSGELARELARTFASAHPAG